MKNLSMLHHLGGALMSEDVMRGHNGAVAKVRREITSRQALIQQLETKRTDILQAAAMDQARARLSPLQSILLSLQPAAHFPKRCVPPASHELELRSWLVPVVRRLRW